MHMATPQLEPWFSKLSNTPIPRDDVFNALWKLGLPVAMIWLINLLVQKYMSLNEAWKVLGECPGQTISWMHPFRTASLLFPDLIHKQDDIGYFYGKFSAYRKHGSTMLSSITFSGSQPTFWTSDAEAFKTITADRRTFPKDIEAYERVGMFGPNIIAIEGPEWKKHRDIIKPAFNEANISLVWSESIRVMNEWFTTLDEGQHNSDGSIELDVLAALNHTTLLIISSAGFGDMPKRSDEPSTGDTPPLHLTLTSALDHFITKITVPAFLFPIAEAIPIPFLSKELRETDKAYRDVKDYLVGVISSARAWIQDGKGRTDAALVRNLVEANLIHGDEQPGSGRTLTDKELLSDTFALFVAGHETSAHTLTFSLLLLALYPDIQQKLFEETLAQWPNGVPAPGLEGAFKETKLEYTTAVVYETLRHFAPVIRVTKDVTADTYVNARSFPTSTQHAPRLKDSTPTKYLMKAGSIVVLEMNVLHMNPLYWGEDAEEFKPERFIDTDTYKWPREAFAAFSFGPRGCIGQRFALTENICILASIVRQYEVLVPTAMEGKSFEEKKKWMLKWRPLLTVTPLNTQVRFRKRAK